MTGKSIALFILAAIAEIGERHRIGGGSRPFEEKAAPGLRTAVRGLAHSINRT